MSRRRSTRHVRGIPTWYRGVRFRSRLEARFARLFDFLAWDWDYEPALDQELDGWLPDFSLTIQGLPRLVECKPALDHAALEPARRKVQASGWSGPTVLLGAVWGVILATANAQSDRWYPFHVGIADDGCCLAPKAPSDPAVTWWLKSGWLDAGNRTQWKPGRPRR